MAPAPKLENFLQERQVDYSILPHPKVYTSRNAGQAAHVPEDHVAKGVLTSDSLGRVLAVVPADSWVRLGALGEALDRDLRLAGEIEVERLFEDCDPGAVPPIGEPYGLETVVDERLVQLADVYLEAGDHSSLIHVTGEGFRELLRGARVGHFAQTG